ncbi:MAG: GWxTD domain-containing protein [bacterium]|nr:GWxTD domain-containing protein [bacterium]
MMQKIVSILITAVLLVVAGNGNHLLAKKNEKKVSKRTFIKQLDQKYRSWLDLTHYIITSTEKEVFFKLSNNRERDSFINMFWNLRDPSKGTPDNEYKEEHLKRFKHADRYFGFGSPLPGWKTDRGRIWILLGEPVTRNEVNSNGLYPVEIWEYFGGAKVGLPTMFRMVFYKRYGAGDYKMYVPTIDSPQSLLREEIGQVDPLDYFGIYSKIKEFEPAVAEVSLSLIPGESLLNYSPSLQSPILLSKIYDLPKRRVNTSYARNFLNYKGMVKTSVVTNYINVKSAAHVFRDPILKLNFIHLALLPDRVSVAYLAEKDQYYCTFELRVILKKGEDTAFQYTKSYPFYYTKAELEQKISHGLVITDYFPVVDGDFQLVALLQNSTNGELSYFETRIKAGNSAADSGNPQLFGPLVSYQIQQVSQPHYSAFQMVDTNVKIDPRRSFGLKDTLYSFFSVDRGGYTKPLLVEMEVRSLDEAREYSKIYNFTLPSASEFRNFTQQLETLHYGNYSLEARLMGEDRTVLMNQKSDFQVSPMSVVPHPPLASKTLRQQHRFLFHMMIAQQHLNINNLAEAELNFEKAYRLNSSFPQLLKFYSTLLFKIKKYDKVLQVIANLASMEKEAFDYNSLKGRAHYQLGQYEAAVTALLKANKIYDSNVTVLNTLGLSFIRLGNIIEAEKVLSASLKINDTQVDIARVLKQIQSKEKKEG